MTKDNIQPRIIRTNDDLLAEWRSIKGPGGFGSPQLWVMFIAGDEGVQLLQIEDVLARPEEGDIPRLMEMLSGFDDLTVAFMFARPGHWPRRADDLAWASELVSGAATAGVRIWPVHVACDDGVQVVEADDLSAAG